MLHIMSLHFVIVSLPLHILCFQKALSLSQSKHSVKMQSILQDQVRHLKVN